MNALPRRALALSPHLDDAAFSCGGTLALLARAGCEVVVATVFAASVPSPTGFALACQTDKGLSPEVDYMALRRAEDADAMRALGARAVWCGEREAPHRGYDSAQALFRSPLAEPALDAALDALIDELLDAHAPDLLLTPQGIGGHVDHVQLVRAALRSARCAALAQLRWRDFPYDIRQARPPEPFADAFASENDVVVALGEAACRARAEACLAYRSQIGFQFGGEAGVEAAFARVGPVERFRAVRGAGATASALGAAR